ncbi:MAG TPA: FAD binding domain-containing protein [Spirochaetales bacterium]|nr:FAD binding domain-containing protein [Spirochaetales bacterium]HRY56258.1 FAD binding domain-containing protein [Spirochaetia bacterium]HRZ63475.1 FAD binding domain-containing protein [Spirochaetia bacterium]
MRRTERYARPASLGEALALKAADPAAAWLAGGTFLLAGDARDKPESLIDLGAFLPRGLSAAGAALAIGAGTSFQELADSRAAPALLRRAALGMANRNVRNRATVGGNLGANRSCSSLIPSLLVLGAELELAEGGPPAAAGLESWLAGPRGLVLSLRIPAEAGRRSACGRWARTACDLSVLSAAVSYRLSAGAMRDLRIALGGLGPRARRFPELEALFEGRPLPSREDMEARIAPLLRPIDDLRGSAEFKRFRAAALAAELLRAAAGQEADA